MLTATDADKRLNETAENLQHVAYKGTGSKVTVRDYNKAVELANECWLLADEIAESLEQAEADGG